MQHDMSQLDKDLNIQAALLLENMQGLLDEAVSEIMMDNDLPDDTESKLRAALNQKVGEYLTGQSITPAKDILLKANTGSYTASNRKTIINVESLPAEDMPNLNLTKPNVYLGFHHTASWFGLRGNFSILP